MRHRPDHSYHWIGHYMDHWSKMHVLFPLMQKCATEVALNLSSKDFAYYNYGPPQILQSDNEREFVNAIACPQACGRLAWGGDHHQWTTKASSVSGTGRAWKCQNRRDVGLSLSHNQQRAWSSSLDSLAA